MDEFKKSITNQVSPEGNKINKEIFYSKLNQVKKNLRSESQQNSRILPPNEISKKIVMREVQKQGKIERIQKISETLKSLDYDKMKDKIKNENLNIKIVKACEKPKDEFEIEQVIQFNFQVFKKVKKTENINALLTENKENFQKQEHKFSKIEFCILKKEEQPIELNEQGESQMKAEDRFEIIPVCDIVPQSLEQEKIRRNENFPKQMKFETEKTANFEFFEIKNQNNSFENFETNEKMDINKEKLIANLDNISHISPIKKFNIKDVNSLLEDYDPNFEEPIKKIEEEKEVYRPKRSHSVRNKFKNSTKEVQFPKENKNEIKILPKNLIQPEFPSAKNFTVNQFVEIEKMKGKLNCLFEKFKDDYNVDKEIFEALIPNKQKHQFEEDTKEKINLEPMELKSLNTPRSIESDINESLKLSHLVSNYQNPVDSRKKVNNINGKNYLINSIKIENEKANIHQKFQLFRSKPNSNNSPNRDFKKSNFTNTQTSSTKISQNSLMKVNSNSNRQTSSQIRSFSEAKDQRNDSKTETKIENNNIIKNKLEENIVKNLNETKKYPVNRNQRLTINSYEVQPNFNKNFNVKTFTTSIPNYNQDKKKTIDILTSAARKKNSNPTLLKKNF